MIRDLLLAARSQGGLYLLLPPAGFVAASLFVVGTTQPQIAYLYTIFEVVLPLAGAAMVGSVVAGHREAGMAELESAFPAAPLRRPVLALMPGLVLLLVAALGLGAWLHRTYLPLDPAVLMHAALPPLVALTGLATAGAAVGRSTLAGLGAAILLWAADLISRGKLNTWAYLFPLRFPPRYMAPPEMERWVAEMHRGALLLGAGAFLIGIWLLWRRRWWIAS